MQLTNETSDISPRRRFPALCAYLLFGVPAFFGVHYFYVGRIKAGAAHAALAVFGGWIVLWMGISIESPVDPPGKLLAKLGGASMVAIMALMAFDLLRILLGVFKDSEGKRIVNW